MLLKWFSFLYVPPLLSQIMCFLQTTIFSLIKYKSHLWIFLDTFTTAAHPHFDLSVVSDFPFWNELFAEGANKSVIFVFPCSNKIHSICDKFLLFSVLFSHLSVPFCLRDCKQCKRRSALASFLRQNEKIRALYTGSDWRRKWGNPWLTIVFKKNARSQLTG